MPHKKLFKDLGKESLKAEEYKVISGENYGLLDNEFNSKNKLILKTFSTSDVTLSETSEINMHTFLSAVDCILEDTSSGDEISSDFPKHQLQNICVLVSKLKSQGVICQINVELLTQFLKTLQKCISKASGVTPITNSNSEVNDQLLHFDAAIELVNGAFNSALIVLYILTSPRISKCLSFEEVLEEIMLFVKFQILNMQPAIRSFNSNFDTSPRLRRNNTKNSPRLSLKHRDFNEKKDRFILLISQHLSEIINLFVELISIQRLTDSLVIHLSSIGISSLVTKINALQMPSLKLLAAIFSKYDKHRQLMIDDILCSDLYNVTDMGFYKIKKNLNICMSTALILELVHGMAKVKIDKEHLASSLDKTYSSIVNISSYFIHKLLDKIGAKKLEDTDCRAVFHNLVYDLLKIFTIPEWPAAELFLKTLCNLFIHNIVNKTTDVSLRQMYLEFLGVITGQLRNHIKLTEEKLKNIDNILQTHSKNEAEEATKNNKQKLQLALNIVSDYLSSRSRHDRRVLYARDFMLLMMHNEFYRQVCSLNNEKKQINCKQLSTNDHFSDGNMVKELKNISMSIQKKFANCNNEIEPNYSLLKDFYIDPEDFEQIIMFLSSKRSFYGHFVTYLNVILKALMETSIHIRTKALKSLASIIEIDNTILSCKEIQLAVSNSLLDVSPQVREAAIDMLGKFIICQKDLIDKYYNVLLSRILDTGISVRKRVIRILIDICSTFPKFHKVPDILVKLVNRINDEDSIKTLVVDEFRNLWFKPVSEEPKFDSISLVNKVFEMIEAIALCNDSIGCFEKLFAIIFQSNDSSVSEIAGRQIIDCLIETAIQVEKSSVDPWRQLSCMTLIYLFSKARPQLLIDHVNTLQPYLSIKCISKKDLQIVDYVAQTLELVIPLIEHPSEAFLARLEEDFIKLIMTQEPNIVKTCISCLKTIVTNKTKNFKLIKETFEFYYRIIKHTKYMLERTNESTVSSDIKPSLNRSMFVVGLFIQYFDFENPELLISTQKTIKDEVVEILLYFLSMEYDYYCILKALGAICIRYQNLLLTEDIKCLYTNYLMGRESPVKLKIQILNNIEHFLLEEDIKWSKKEEEWKKYSKTENLKEINDINQGQASNIVQQYLNSILESMLHPNKLVRNAAIKVIELIIVQGLIHPLQMMPYLICMCTDDDKIIRRNVEKRILEIESKYPGYTHTKALCGVQLSFNFQKILKEKNIIRGFRNDTDDSLSPYALNWYVYTLLKTKQQRRSLIMSIVRQFDENTKVSLEYLVYLADNMAYFPYCSVDDIMFVLYQIDIILSVTGTNMIQMFQENLQPKVINDKEYAQKTEDDKDSDDEDNESKDEIFQRFPTDLTPLQQCINASQGCLLLGSLKKHLKKAYNISDDKLVQYSPSDNSKTNEKKSVVHGQKVPLFNPQSVLERISKDLPSDSSNTLISQYLELKHLIQNLDSDDFIESGCNTQVSFQGSETPQVVGNVIPPDDHTELTDNSLTPRIKTKRKINTCKDSTGKKPKLRNSRRAKRKYIIYSSEESDE